MRKQRQLTGKFWPRVRELIWAKAQELYQWDEVRGVNKDFGNNCGTKGATGRRLLLSG